MIKCEQLLSLDSFLLQDRGWLPYKSQTAVHAPGPTSRRQKLWNTFCLLCLYLAQVQYSTSTAGHNSSCGEEEGRVQQKQTLL